MQRARGPWWTALSLLAVFVIVACDHDEGDTATTYDVVAGDESVGSDDDDGDDPSDAADDGEDDLVSLTCMELECGADEVCVQPRAYCDESTDPAELRRDPAYCQPVALPLVGLMRVEAGGGPVGLAGCDDPQTIQGPDGQVFLACPEIDVPCV